MVGDAVVVFAAVNLVGEAVELRADLAQFGDDDFLILAARARIGGRAALRVQIKAPRPDQRQLRGEMEPERKHFAE